jgi:2'-hydroxyisoflavone reductase
MINVKRRKFLLGLGAVGMGVAAGPALSSMDSRRKLKILLLGGTGFIGPHIVERAISRGHDVTLFNRGRSNTDLFPEVRKLKGDRDNDLDALKTGRWDVVIDNSGYVPRHVKDSAAVLQDSVGRYLFTSSISAYDFSRKEFPYRPGSELVPWTNPDSEDAGVHYSEFKAECERRVQAIYADRATVVRPTFIVGPGDTSERFTWWVDRIYRGGEVLAPGNPDTNSTLIDVRDLAAFYIRLAEDDRAGEFNASGPAEKFSFGSMLNGIRTTSKTNANFHWVTSAFLAEQGVIWHELPLWGFIDDGVTELTIENQSSIAAGLEFRSFNVTTQDTIDWYRQLPGEEQKFTRVGIDPFKEARVLAAWREHMAGEN